MRIAWVIGILGLLVCGGCSQVPMKRSSSWESQLGQRVTVEGMAVNAKEGAAVLDPTTRGILIWMDGLEAWPEGFSHGGGKGKRLRVTGTVIKRSDRPVFIYEPGDLPQAGIPMPKGTDLEKAAVRYLLQDASWEVTEGSE